MYGDEWKIPFLIQLSAPTQSHMNLNTFLMRLISLGQSIQSQNNAQVCYKIGTGSCRNILLIGTRRETSIYDLHLRFALFKQDHALAINGDLFIRYCFQPCEVNWLDPEQNEIAVAMKNTSMTCTRLTGW